VLAEKCFPQGVLTGLKFVTCHEWALPVRGMVPQHQYLISDLVIVITRHVS
jgi:hypothetical protein